MSNEFIRVENLCKSYGEIKASQNLNFTAQKGEIIALVGENGAGKTTLMNMLAGFLSPDSGDIFVCSKNIKDNPIWGKEHIGFLPEGSPLYDDMSVKAFLEYMAELRGLGADEVKKVIEIAKINNVASQRIETLSKGYRRRVGFAQSILSSPPILLLDEPTDGLDPNQKRHIRGLISAFGKDKTIIISTHLLEEAENLCARIILIDKGKIVADGTLEAVLSQYQSPSLEEVFFKLSQTREDNR